MRALLIITLMLCACDWFEPERETQPPDTEVGIDSARTQHAARIAQLAELSSAHPSGWAAPNSCDGALWSYKAAAATCPPGFNADASAYPDEPGRYGRTPPPRCWPKVGQAHTSETTWSGDMGKGLFGYAWRCGRLDMLIDHAEHGKENLWQMGEGAPGSVLSRAVYRPSMVGLLYSLIYAMGGSDNVNRHWPNVYPSGLTDFEAHLQMLTIWIVGEVAEASGDADAVPRALPPGARVVRSWPETGKKHPIDGPNTHLFDASTPPFEALLMASGAMRLLEVSETMYQRIEEHYARDSADPLFAAMHAIYAGDYAPILAICSQAYAPGMYVGEYVRCDDQSACELAHYVHACDIALRRYN